MAFALQQSMPGTLEMDWTGLQELYVNPHKPNANNWDVIQAAANWSKANKKALVHVHWFGGSPLKQHVYGCAGWANVKCVLSIRNPTAHAKVFT